MAPCEDDIATASTGWDRQVSPEVEEGYTVIRDLGSGKFAWVKEVQQKGSKKRFAWKHVVMEKNPLCEVEVELLRRMKHENIVGIHDVYSAFGVMDIMLELCKGGSMREYMLSKSEEVFRGCTVYEPPEPSEVRNTMHQLLTALNFLHGNLVAHRDIKPDNVLLSSRGRWKTWKLADFNLACEFEPKSPMTETVGSRPFTAPEVYEGHYTEKCDLYSMGVLFIAFVTGLMYTGKDCENDPQKKKDVEKLWDEKRWNRRAGSGSMDLAKKMIAPEKDRCHAEEALRTMLAQLRSSGASEGACCVIA